MYRLLLALVLVFAAVDARAEGASDTLTLRSVTYSNSVSSSRVHKLMRT
jgi:hypothetical protein